MNNDDIIELLKRRMKEEGLGQTKFAKAHGLSQGYLGNVLRGMNKPGPKITALLGLKLVRDYQPIKK